MTNTERRRMCRKIIRMNELIRNSKILQNTTKDIEREIIRKAVKTTLKDNVERIKYEDKTFSLRDRLWAKKEIRDEKRKYVKDRVKEFE